MTTEKTREFQESRDGVAERERTATTLLAAMTDYDELYGGTLWRWTDDKPHADRLSVGAQQRVALAVALADALRAALRGGGE